MIHYYRKDNEHYNERINIINVWFQLQPERSDQSELSSAVARHKFQA